MSMTSIRSTEIDLHSGQKLCAKRLTRADWLMAITRDGKLESKKFCLTSQLECLARLGNKYTKHVKLGPSLPKQPNTPIVNAVKQEVVTWLQEQVRHNKIQLNEIDTKDVNELIERVLFARAQAHRSQETLRSKHLTKCRNTKVIKIKTG